MLLVMGTGTAVDVVFLLLSHSTLRSDVFTGSNEAQRSLKGTQATNIPTTTVHLNGRVHEEIQTITRTFAVPMYNKSA